MEGDQHSRGLDPLALKESLWDRDWFSWEKGWIWKHSTASLAPRGMEEGWALHSSACVVGGPEAVAQAETWETQDGDKEKPFPHGDSPV